MSQIDAIVALMDAQFLEACDEDWEIVDVAPLWRLRNLLVEKLGDVIGQIAGENQDLIAELLPVAFIEIATQAVQGPVPCDAMLEQIMDHVDESHAAQIRTMAGQMVQLQGAGVLQALLDARNLITTRAKDLIADPNFGGDSHA